MTDTGDAEGVVIKSEDVPDISHDQLMLCLQSFVGEIDQVPPMYSALKHNGKKLYELAREGITIERKARRISIFDLKLLASSLTGQNKTNQLVLEVFCSKGTYIRSLAEDLGDALGTCGTVLELRRLEAGMFNIAQAKTIEQLTAMSVQELQQSLIAIDSPLQAFPAVNLSEQQAVAIKYGQSVQLISGSIEGVVRLYHDEVFLGLGEMLLDGKIAPKRLFNMDNL